MSTGTSPEELEAEVVRELLEEVLCLLAFGAFEPSMEAKKVKRRKVKRSSNHGDKSV